MSELVFPRVRDRSALELRLAALALVALTAFGLFSLWLGASFVGLVGGDVVVTARVASLGDSLGVNSSVKFRGLRVGRVVSVEDARDEDGLYSARVVIDEEFVAQIPGDVQARVLPGTLFGAEYVELRPGPGAIGSTASPGSAKALEDGAVVVADTSRESLRLMDTFSALHRVISAVDPAAMDLALSQLSGALDGRGEDLRVAIGQVSKLVEDYRKLEPAFHRDLSYLSQNLDTLSEIEPDLAAALRSSLPLARTVADKARELELIERSATALAADVSAFLEANGATLARLLDEVAPTYRAFVAGRGSFTEILRLTPAVLVNGARAVHDGAITMLARFSAQRGDPYGADDCPRYGSLQGRNCP